MIAQTNSTRKSEQITREQFKLAMASIGQPNFVPPVSEFKLGRLALRQGYTPQAVWPDLMAQGWDFEGARCNQLAMMADAA